MLDLVLVPRRLSLPLLIISKQIIELVNVISVLSELMKYCLIPFLGKL
jgi:hypothetical protein